jgi:cell shape-determining protein MreD
MYFIDMVSCSQAAGIYLFLFGCWGYFFKKKNTGRIFLLSLWVLSLWVCFFVAVAAVINNMTKNQLEEELVYSSNRL